MKEKDPLGNPFIGEPKGVQPAKYGGWAANPCGHCSLLCPKGVVFELKG
jgi:hypothetical protein